MGGLAPREEQDESALGIDAKDDGGGKLAFQPSFQVAFRLMSHLYLSCLNLKQRHTAPPKTVRPPGRSEERNNSDHGNAGLGTTCLLRI